MLLAEQLLANLHAIRVVPYHPLRPSLSLERPEPQGVEITLDATLRCRDRVRRVQVDGSRDVESARILAPWTTVGDLGLHYQLTDKGAPILNCL